MVPLHIQLANSTLRRVIKRLHFPLEIMLVCVRWYAAYPLSLRNLDKSGANTAAARGLIADSGVTIELRQSKYLNNLVEHDHRAIKRRVRPMMGFKSFWSARRLLAGIETLHMINKGQMRCPDGQPIPAAQQFYSLAL